MLPIFASIARAAAGPAAPGLHELVVPLAGVQVELTSVLPVPDPTDPTPPLVVALHYAGKGANHHYATPYVTSLVAPGLAALGAVIVAPDCPDRNWTTPESEKVVLALVDYAVKTWHADPKRIVITGYSMGGGATWFYAARHPDRFAVAVPMASDPQTWAETETLPTYAIHGAHDELFPASRVEGAVAELAARGVPASYVEVEKSHYQVAEYADALAASVEWIRAHFAR